MAEVTHKPGSQNPPLNEGLGESFEDAFGGLSSKEQDLLFRFHDRQLGFVGRLRAGALLRRNPVAQKFCDDWSRSENLLRESLDIECSTHLASLDAEAMWSRIDAQITQEQHAMLLARRGLGREAASTIGFSLLQDKWGLRAKWGFSGAAVGAAMSAAMVLLVVSPTNSPLGSQIGAPIGEVALFPSSSTTAGNTVQNGAAFDTGTAPRAEVSRVGRSQMARRFGSSAPIARDVSLGGGGAGSARAGLQSRSRTLTNADSSDLDTSGGGEGYRQIGAQEFDLSEAIAVALAERTRRDAAAQQPLMSLGGNGVIEARTGQADRMPSYARAPRAIEVDWMRSRGRVRMFHDPVEKAAYIWVQPNRRLASGSLAQVLQAQSSSNSSEAWSADSVQ